ncbi:hypothetical protein ACHAQJ_002930 [Trichoderma viride]
MATFLQNNSISLSEEEIATLKILLKTPYEKVFKLSPDGKTFLEPSLLRGTPVQRIDESHEYWERSWDSVDTVLARQEPEAKKKQEAYARTQFDPNNKALQEALKRYSDNSSKYKKIREIFGKDGKYHPNQIIGKRYLPPQGLCQKESMYRLACKITDLEYLHKTGVLAMDPFDFIRWRVMKKAVSLLAKPGDNPKQFLRTIISKLGDDSGDPKAKAYQDSVMRQAVLLSAHMRNQLGNYGPKKKIGVAQPMLLPSRPRQTALPQRPKLLKNDVENLPETPLAPAIRVERQRARPIARPPIYTGVNAYRAKQRQQRQAERPLNGN